MKISSILWLLLATVIHAGTLTFPETRKELHAPAEVKTVTCDFEFTNRSNQPVTIRQFNGACSCMSVQVKDSKLRYLPGESGTVRTIFDMGNFSGAVDKTVALWLDHDPEDQPSISLTVHVIIPVLVLLEPKTLKWDLNGKPDPQTIHITMAHSQPIKVLSINSSSEAYSYQLKTITEGKSYDLTITPLDIQSPSLAIFRINTDCSIEKFKIAQAFAQVRKLLPATGKPTP